MNIDLALVCDYAIIDQYGKLSVLGIFEHIRVHEFPVVHPRLHLVIRLKGRRTEIGEHAVNIRLVDENGGEVIGGDGTVTFAEPPAGIVEIEAGTVLLFDVPFEDAGTYTFEISIDGDVASFVPITVALAPEHPPKPLGLH